MNGIKKVTVTKVYKGTTKKDGSPYMITKGQYAGQPFTRIGIQTEQTGDKTYYNNAKASDKAMTIAEGQSVLLNFTEQVDGENTWYNWSFPTKEELAKFAESLA